MTEYGGSTFGAGYGYAGQPRTEVLMNTSWGTHTQAPGGMENVQYQGMSHGYGYENMHLHGHENKPFHGHENKPLHKHECKKATKVAVVAPAVKRVFAAELVLFVLLVIIIRCSQY